MEVGVGLPTTTPGADGRCLLEWARRSEDGAVRQPGGAGPGGVSQRRAVRCPGGGGRGHDPGPAGDHGGDRALRNTVLLAKQAASSTCCPAAGSPWAWPSGPGPTTTRRSGSTRPAGAGAWASSWPSCARSGEGRGRARAGPGGRPAVAGRRDVRGGVRPHGRSADGYVHGGGPPRAFAGAAAKAWAAWRTWSGRAAPSCGARLLRPRRRRGRRRLPARLLRPHRPLRREDRRRQPHQRPCRQGLRPRRGGRPRLPGPAAHRLRPGPARPPGRRARPRRPMRIGVSGGGPAGLYFALLASGPTPPTRSPWSSRNAPDATFGWGVVFSEETLGRCATPTT